MEFIKESLLPHWPFILFALVIGVLAQLLKTQICTKEAAKKSKCAFWSRRLFPLILIFLGAMTGLLWPGAASPGVDETMEKVLYFMGSACAAIAGFNVLKTWVKKKYDVDIMPTNSEPPKPVK
jgi:hypothetical protein